MGKKKSRDRFDLTGVDVTKVVSQHVNKNGKLTGSKQERKAMRSICTHHIINKKGKKVKARIKAENHGKYCTCSICKERMRTEFYSDQEVEATIKPAKELLSQAKLIAGAINADMRTTQRICEANLYLDAFPSWYRSERKVAQKKQNIRRKKDNKKQSAYDSWFVKR